MNNEPKEVGVFNSYSKHNKLKTFLVAVLIIAISFTTLYFLVKSLFVYTITYDLNGGSVYKQEFVEQKYRFLEKIEEPKNIKKFGVDKNGEEYGYYIEYYSKNKDLTDRYTFGKRIWNSFKLYIKWEEGKAVRLHFAEGEENKDMSTADLKGYYEQYVKPGTTYTMPLVFNDVDKDSEHYGEQLLWYDNPECTGDPFDTRTFVVSDNIDLYGKWFDTNTSKFVVDGEGTLTKYKGYCDNVILPYNVKKIKDINIDSATGGTSIGKNDVDGDKFSVWANVLSGDNSLKIIYLNNQLTHIGSFAFFGCDQLEKVIYNGDNIESIGSYAFAYCEKLSVGKYAYGLQSEYDFVIPSKVKTIGDHAFHMAFDKTKKVNLTTNNVEQIEDCAFGSSNIQKVTLEKANYLGKDSFSSCHVLTEVTINSTEKITSNAPSTNVSGSIFYNSKVNPNLAGHIEIFVTSEEYKNSLVSLPYWGIYKEIIVVKE